MLRSSVAVLASMAVATQAFLLPPSISMDGMDLSTTTQGAFLDGHKQMIKLDCPGCPFIPTTNDAQSTANALVMTFTVDEKDPNALLLNGFQLYPPRFAAPEPIYAPQIPASVSLVDFAAAEYTFEGVPLGYHLAVKPAPVMATAETQVLTLDFQVNAVRGQAVDGLPTLKAVFIRTAHNGLRVARVEQLAARPSHGHCRTLPLLCKWRAILLHNLGRVRSGFRAGCHKMRLPTGLRALHGHLVRLTLRPVPSHSSSSAIAASHDVVASHDAAMAHPHRRPHHHQYAHGHAHGHHGHRQHHRFLRTLQAIALHVIVPILIGVAAGMTAGLLGMVIGRLTVFLWRRFVRRPSAYVALPLVEAEKDLPGYDDSVDGDHLVTTVIYVDDEEK
ncbi:MAG: hypothetical protein M1826_005488 [Phylliscum demangeonii]|nr:MAG: hypothetical protein M1826_005488 [Phylliscum demangeonii]